VICDQVATLKGMGKEREYTQLEHKHIVLLKKDEVFLVAGEDCDPPLEQVEAVSSVWNAMIESLTKEVAN
jgi:hypothetical protein